MLNTHRDRSSGAGRQAGRFYHRVTVVEIARPGNGAALRVPDRIRPASTAPGPSYCCGNCHFAYNPTRGDPTQGLAPGTPFRAAPAGWKCPSCGSGRDVFDRSPRVA